MSKKHQYLVSSRKGQTAVHKKERRNIRQKLGAFIIDENFCLQKVQAKNKPGIKVRCLNCKNKWRRVSLDDFLVLKTGEKIQVPVSRVCLRCPKCDSTNYYRIK